MWKIQEYLTDKSALPLVYGNFISKRWNQDEFVIAGRTRAHAEPTIATTGVEKAQASQHYDDIILDDLVVRENISTKEQLEKVITFYKDTLDLLEPNGRITVVGTRWTLGDLYQHLIENESRSFNGHWLKSTSERSQWRDYVGKPLQEEPMPERPLPGFDVYMRQAIENGKAIFPEKFCIDEEEGKESLTILKMTKGSYSFSAQQMNDPVDDDAIEFKRGFYKEYEVLPKIGTDLMFVDPAFTLKESNDSIGIIVSRFTDDNIVFVMEALAQKREPTGLVDEIFKLWEIYPHIIRTKVESNIAQVVLMTLLRNEMLKRNKFFLIEEYKAPTRENKTARIRGLIPRYESGGFRFAKGLNILKDQMIEFPRGRKNDVIDALSQGLEEWGTPSKVMEPEKEVRTFNWWAERIHRPTLTVMGSGFYDITGRK